MSFLSRAQGLSEVVSRPIWTGAPSNLQSVEKDLSYLSWCFTLQGTREEEAGGCTAQPPQTLSVACSSSATASSSFLMEVFLEHRQQTQSLCSSVSHFVMDLLPKF